MITIDMVNSVSGLISFFAWTLAVMTFAYALVGSFLMQELRHYYFNSNPKETARRERKLHELSWELKHKVYYDEDVINKVPTAAARAIEPAVLEDKRVEFLELTDTTRLTRIINYFSACVRCQCFWSAILLLAIFAPTGTSIATILLSALAYSTSAWWLNNLIIANTVLSTPSNHASSCSCGKK